MLPLVAGLRNTELSLALVIRFYRILMLAFSKAPLQFQSLELAQHITQMTFVEAHRAGLLEHFASYRAPS